MTGEPKDGGQAFPTHPMLYSSADQGLAQGMSLRDWFAGQAIPAVSSDLAAIGVAAQSKGWTPAKAIAVASYEVADAMLAARGQA